MTRSTKNLRITTWFAAPCSPNIMDEPVGPALSKLAASGVLDAPGPAKLW